MAESFLMLSIHRYPGTFPCQTSTYRPLPKAWRGNFREASILAVLNSGLCCRLDVANIWHPLDAHAQRTEIDTVIEQGNENYA